MARRSMKAEVRSLDAILPNAACNEQLLVLVRQLDRVPFSDYLFIYCDPKYLPGVPGNVSVINPHSFIYLSLIKVN